MRLTPVQVFDRCAGVLSAQLLSSQTSGTFQINTTTALGSQLATVPTGTDTIVTIENEQINCSGFSDAAGTVTATIATNGRGYNGTSAATHAISTAVEIHHNKAVHDRIQDHVKRFDDLGVIDILGTTVPTVSSATVHTLTGDYTADFTAGRIYFFKITGTWWRAVVRSSTLGGGTTTINITGDGLPAAGTITNTAFGMGVSALQAIDYSLAKQATNAPATNPPAGYSWLWNAAGNWLAKDSSGNVRFLTPVRSTAASSGGVLTLDWSLAQVYDVTLTENVTSVTHSGGVEGQRYVLRIKQHASAAKTVVLGTAGGTRFSNDIPSYVMTTDVSATDELAFLYHGTDAKYDLLKYTKGFQASPVGASVPITATFTAGENIAANDGVYIKASDGKAWRTDADADESTYSFVGFATAAATTNGSIVVALPGSVLDGFTARTIGEQQYLSGTVGAISNAPHATRLARIGLAVSTTKMLILPPRFVRSGSQAASAVTTYVQTCGFYPSKIKIISSAASNANSWGDDTNMCFYNENGGALTIFTATMAWNGHSASPGNINRGTVSAKSQTGFTLNCAQADVTATVYWIAEN